MSASCQQATSRYSFDHLVGEREQLGRELGPERSSGFQVDNELQLGGSLHWKFGGVCSFQNLTGVNADLTIRIGNTRSVIHEATGRRKFPPRINSRDFVDLR